MVIISHNPILNSIMYQLSSKGYNKLPVNLVTCSVIIEYIKNNFNHQFLQTGRLSIIFFPEYICKFKILI